MQVSIVPHGKPGANLAGWDLILDGRDYKGKRIHYFMRDVDVYWSPDSRHIAVTAWMASNHADCLVFDSRKPGQEISVSKSLPENSQFENAHLYIACLGWPDNSHIVI